jgi:tape measure domain-containing protein
MAETNEFYIKIGADVKDAQDKLNSLSAELSKLSTVTQTTSTNISGSMGGASRAISSAFAAIGVSLSIASIIGVGKSALKTAADLEQTAVAFKVFTGSAETANAMLSELKAQALNSPMQFQDITKGAQTLLQYGLTAKQTTEITRMLGDVSGGNADKFQRLSLAFGQVTAAGRLMGQEARQMINAGFNPLQAISDKTGQSMAVLTQKMHDGQISVKDVADAFIYATSEGGRFFGMADEQSKTLAGAYNKMSESISFTLAEIGNNLNESLDLSSAATHISNLVAKIGENFESTGSKSTFWGNALKEVLSTLALALDIVIKGVKLFANAIEDLVNISGLDKFSNWLDQTTIKVAGLFGPEAQKNVRDFIGYLHSFDAGVVGVSNSMPSNLSQALPLMEKQMKELRQKMELQIFIDPKGYLDSWEKLKKLGAQIDLLKKGSGRTGSSNLGFSSTPSRSPDKEKKTQKYETVIFPDFITKDVGTKIKAFIQENKDAATTISNWWSTSETKRLAELKKNYERDVAFATKYGLDLTNIEKKYNSERLLITQKFSEGNVSARDAARKKVIEQSTRDVNDALLKQKGTLQQTIDSLLSSDIANRMVIFGQSIYAASKDLGQDIAVGFGSVFGEVLAGTMNIENAFKSLGAVMLNSIGDYLIKVGSAAIALGLLQEVFSKIFKNPIGEGGKMGIGAGILAVAVGTALKTVSGKLSDSAKTISMASRASGGNTGSTAGASVANRASGSSYSYGGASYAMQSIRLAIDLTGAITATQTGYQINKSLETTLRVTGRQ